MKSSSQLACNIPWYIMNPYWIPIALYYYDERAIAIVTNLSNFETVDIKGRYDINQHTLHY